MVDYWHGFLHVLQASMRPRLISRGYDTPLQRESENSVAASMRPRLISRGYSSSPRPCFALPASFNEAATYQSRISSDIRGQAPPIDRASMRPRLISRGYHVGHALRTVCGQRFNEAATYQSRIFHTSILEAGLAVTASMRPRLISRGYTPDAGDVVIVPRKLQ